jgi:hypothetical protein
VRQTPRGGSRRTEGSETFGAFFVHAWLSAEGTGAMASGTRKNHERGDPQERLNGEVNTGRAAYHKRKPTVAFFSRHV